jgi:hypothetical protein
MTRKKTGNVNIFYKYLFFKNVDCIRKNMSCSLYATQTVSSHYMNFDIALGSRFK